MLPLLVWTACGSGPGNPSPSPSPTAPQPGGPVTGRYLAQVTPAPGCAMSRATLSFPVQAAAAATPQHAGVQALLVGDGSRFELEFLSTEIALRGGVGTTEEGVLANEGQRVWIHAVGAGPVFRTADGRGQILSGTLTGYVAVGAADDVEDDAAVCTATDHAFVLRAQ
jgi:hypothetical protein